MQLQLSFVLTGYTQAMHQQHKRFKVALACCNKLKATAPPMRISISFVRIVNYEISVKMLFESDLAD